MAAFESGNQTQLSACAARRLGSAPTARSASSELIAFATNPNLPGEVKNIVPAARPSRTATCSSSAPANEALLSTASGVGTLLYGLAVAANGTIYVSQTDARNLVNGDHGLTLADLDGRMFDNEIATVTLLPARSCTHRRRRTSSPGPAPRTRTRCATPYGIALSGNDSTLLVTAAGASRLASFDTAHA